MTDQTLFAVRYDGAAEAPPSEASPMVPPGRIFRSFGEPQAPAATEPPAADRGDVETGLAFSEAELGSLLASAAWRARRDAFDEIDASGAAAQSRCLATLQALLVGLDQDYRRLVADNASQQADLALIIAQAIVPRALEKAPLDDLMPMIEEVLSGLMTQPHIRIAVAPALADELENQIASLATPASIIAKVEVTGDAAIKPGDVRLSWDQGHARRDHRALTEQVMAIANSLLSPPANSEPNLPVEPIEEADHE
ncbi:MAG: hypothetical protein ACFB6S_17785 [Geminicoccaceae bacterium]